MKRVVSVLLVASMLGFSGCTRIANWAQRNFYQGKPTADYFEIPEVYVRSITVYDQFTTVAMFDALWLSQRVREDFVQRSSYRLFKSEDQKKAAELRQQQELTHFIDFYVLSLYTIRLDQSSLWGIALVVDGVRYLPVEIKQVTLEPEYAYFFGNALTHFKTPYLVRFASQNNDNTPVINDRSRVMSLEFHSVDRDTALVWHLDNLCDVTSDDQLEARGMELL